MNLNDLRMSLKAALDNMWARIDARITAIEQGGGGGVTGVKGNAEASYRQGNVNLTPANIGAVAKDGDTMTGDLITDSDIILTDGYLQGAENDGINHAIKLGHYDDNVMEFNEYGGLYNFYRNASNPRELIFQINGSQGISDAPLPVPSGGTGANTAAGARANLHAMQNPDTSAPQYTTGNLNDAPVGFSAWYGDGCVNAPFTSWMSVLTISIIAGYVQQIAFPWFPWHSGSNRIAYRVCDNGTWHAWSFITMS